MADHAIATATKESTLAPEPVDPAETEPLDDEQVAFVVLLHAWDEFVKTLESGYITDCMKHFASCCSIPENSRP